MLTSKSTRNVTPISKSIAEKAVRDGRVLLNSSCTKKALGPLALSVNYESFRQLKAIGLDSTSLLADEIHFWRQCIGHRDVSCFEFCDPGRDLEPFEITQLTYKLASEFRILPLKEREHRAVCGLDDLDIETIALLKGLGFNQFQVRVESTADLTSHQLMKVLCEVENFHFSEVGIQLVHADSLPDLAMQLRSLQKHFTPSYFFLGTDSRALRLETIKHEERSFIDQSNLKHCEVIGLGPCAISNFKSREIRNHSKPEKYAEAIKNGLAPF